MKKEFFAALAIAAALAGCKGRPENVSPTPPTPAGKTGLLEGQFAEYQATVTDVCQSSTDGDMPVGTTRKRDKTVCKGGIQLERGTGQTVTINVLKGTKGQKIPQSGAAPFEVPEDKYALELQGEGGVGLLRPAVDFFGGDYTFTDPSGDVLTLDTGVSRGQLAIKVENVLDRVATTSVVTPDQSSGPTPTAEQAGECISSDGSFHQVGEEYTGTDGQVYKCYETSVNSSGNRVSQFVDAQGNNIVVIVNPQTNQVLDSDFGTYDPSSESIQH